MAYEYGKWDFSMINDVLNYIIYELWKVPLAAWAWLPDSIKLAIQIFTLIITLIVLYHFWKKKDEWQHVHTSSTRLR